MSVHLHLPRSSGQSQSGEQRIQQAQERASRSSTSESETPSDRIFKEIIQDYAQKIRLTHFHLTQDGYEPNSARNLSTDEKIEKIKALQVQVNEICKISLKGLDPRDNKIPISDDVTNSIIQGEWLIKAYLKTVENERRENLPVSSNNKCCIIL